MSPHDYRNLITRWRSLARRARLRLQPLAVADGFPLYYLATPPLGNEGGVYLSAGIHGDEPAGTEGLLAWAEANWASLRDRPLLLFPCLNPWGLTQNTRNDAAGRDLNRSFHRHFPMIRAVRKIAGQRRFTAAVHLHEDFDGEGLYLYELCRGAAWGESLLQAVRPIMAPDPRRRIDRWHARGGVIRRAVRRSMFGKIGYPEACWLWFEHTDRALTIETPSELSLDNRVAAQVSVLTEIARRATG